MSDELLPCPFCGERPRQSDRPDIHNATGHIWFIACYCGGYSSTAHKMGETQDEVRSKWNTRAAIQQAQQQDEPLSMSMFASLADFEAAQQAAGCEHLRGDSGSRWCALAEKPAPSPAVPPDDEPAAWLIEFEIDGMPMKVAYTHNAIADYRHLDPKAKSSALYLPPPRPEAPTGQMKKEGGV